jgi:ankyrin repeat protein
MYEDGKAISQRARSRNKEDFASPLYYVCLLGLLPNTIWLLEHEQSSTCRRDVLSSALMAAAAEGQEDIVRVLLKNGADPNARDFGQLYDPLQAAAWSGDESTVRLLLKAGADIRAQGGEMGTALHVAVIRWNLEAIKLLVEWGANIDAMSERYGFLLTAAAEHGNDEVIALLLSKSADPRIYGGHY